jgi:minor extracellular serine protease Vpr
MTPWYKRIALSGFLVAFLASTAFADLAKLDPRARVALAGLQGAFSVQTMMKNQAAVSAAGELDVFIVGNVSRAELEAAGAVVRTELPNGIYTAYIPVESIDAVAGLTGVSRIQGAAPVEEQLNVSVPTTLAPAQHGPAPTFTGANGAGILIGDVDSGVDYGHEDFDDALGNTRLVNIWDQTDALGPNPFGYAYGSEWTPADINANTARERDTSQHGTHVLSIAGGDGSAVAAGSAPAFTYVGVAPMADLIMVKTNFLTTGVADGVSYIFGRATALGKNAVCNLSLGSQYGPHDGTSPFETALTGMTGPGRVVVVSMGNDRGTARHAQVFAAGAGTDVTMSAAGNALNRAIAIDGYYEASEQVNVQIRTPNGTIIGPITLGNINAAYPGQVTANGAVYIENGASLTATGDKEVYIEINNTGAGQNFNGTWTFTFIPVALGAANGEVDLWRFFSSGGVTANFVIGNLNTQELLSEPACAVGVISVASWTTKINWTDCGNRPTTYGGTPPVVGAISPFSSMGPTRDGRQKPDIAAPGMAIAAARSDDLVQACPAVNTFLLPGLRHIINQGTSMAAPHVTGAVALLMQKFGAITPAFAKAHLAADGLVDGNTGGVWNKDWGFGKMRVDVTDPVAAVTAPNGGEIYTIAGNYNITWNASDPLIAGNPVTINILLSRTGSGGPYTPLATGIANSGSFNWNVTGPPTIDAWIKVEAIDPCTNQGSDLSDAQFTIASIPVPIELAAFAAESVDDGVKVSWKFADDSEFAGVLVERATLAQGPFAPLSSPIVSEEGTYNVVDGTIDEGVTYYYRLVAVSRGGETVMFGPLSVTAGRVITRFDLAPVWPNPTAGLARVDFTVPRESQVRVLVFDVQGRQVATLADGSFTAGRHQVTWDGAADDGSGASGGIYFVHMVTPDGRNLVQRVTIAR